jgi:hypothetical protein
MTDIITHILDDEIPECELLKMLEELEQESEKEWKEIATIAKEQNRKFHRAKKAPKVSKSIQSPKEKIEPCVGVRKIRFIKIDRSVDYRFCKGCWRMFMDSQPLQGKVFTDASFNIEIEDLDRP